MVVAQIGIRYVNSLVMTFKIAEGLLFTAGLLFLSQPNNP